MIRNPFTGQGASPPYTSGPVLPFMAPAAPSVRSASLPPVTAPQPGRWGRRKSGTPPAASPPSYVTGPGAGGTIAPVHGYNSTIGRIR